MHDEDEKTPIFNIMCTGLVALLFILAIASFFKPGLISYIIAYVMGFFVLWFVCTMGTVLIKPKWKLEDQCICGCVIAIFIYLATVIF